MKFSPLQRVVIAALVPELMHDMRVLARTLVCQPFPNGPIIMATISRMFPEASQKQCCDLSQVIKTEIAKIDLSCNLAKTNPTSN